MKTTRRTFKVIPGDEAATHAAFAEYVGGIARAERLSRLYSDSYPGIKSSMFAKPSTKEQIFTRKALGEGFTLQEVAAYLSL